MCPHKCGSWHWTQPHRGMPSHSLEGVDGATSRQKREKNLCFFCKLTKHKFYFFI